MKYDVHLDSQNANILLAFKCKDHCFIPRYVYVQTHISLCLTANINVLIPAYTALKRNFNVSNARSLRFNTMNIAVWPPRWLSWNSFRLACRRPIAGRDRPTCKSLNLKVKILKPFTELNHPPPQSNKHCK